MADEIITTTATGNVAVNPDENVKNAHGWKTYLAAAVGVLSAAQAAFVDHDYKTALSLLAGAIALIGIRGAFAKLITASRSIAAK